MIPFANFKFRGTLFSKIRPNFCRRHKTSVFKIQKFPCMMKNIASKSILALGSSVFQFAKLGLLSKVATWHYDLSIGDKCQITESNSEGFS